jgi:type 1 fimbriae regulatory protein FimB/type 1 fimbriae regulatory protein FimE
LLILPEVAFQVALKMPANLKLVERQKSLVMPEVKTSAGRKTDAEYGRERRKHLTETEVEALMKAALVNRHRKRDRLMITLAFHHCLRAGELCSKRGLQWSDIDLDAGTIQVTRLKGGRSGKQPLNADCHRWLTALKKARTSSKPWVFITERDTVMSTDAFADQLKAAAERAKIPNVHPHSLRHACGNALAEANLPAYKLQAYMGHRKAASTPIYIDAAASQHQDAARILSGKGGR